MCYYVSDASDRVDYRTAYEKCSLMGASLVSISDQDEMNFVLSISYVDLMLQLNKVLKWPIC